MKVAILDDYQNVALRLADWFCRLAARRDHRVQRPCRRSLGGGRTVAAIRGGVRHARTHAA
jgi:hypothetical protein